MWCAKGVKLEGQGAGIEWSALLASAQAMVKRHQHQLAEELKTDSGNAPPAQQQQHQQHLPQYQQALSQNGVQSTAAAAGLAVAGPSAGQNVVTAPSSGEQQQSGVEDQGQGVTVKQEVGGASQSSSEEAWLSDMVSGCVSMLLTMQKCAQQPVAGHLVNAALVNSLKMLQPHAASNQPIYRKIEQTVTVLRNQLLHGSPR